jgi:hypothetical protein
MAFDRETAVPGEDYVLIFDGDGKLRRDDRLKANLHRYQLYQALLQGGDHILYPPQGTLHPVTGGVLHDGSYLDRLPAETSVITLNGVQYDAFHERVKRSAHEPIAETIISTYVDALFGQAIDRAPVKAALSAEIWDDIDLRGNSVEHFLAYVYAQGLTLGWGCVLTDMPRVEPGSVPSRLHELADGRRPYCRWIPPTRIWQWELDPTTNEFTMALIHESENRWRLWTADGYQLLDEEGEPVPGGTGEHDFGKVPLDIFIADEPDIDTPLSPLGMSAIRSSALMQLQVDQHASLLDDLQRKTNFPFLHARGDEPGLADDVEQDKTIGPDVMMYYDGDMTWVAPPAVCAQEARAHIDRLESRIYKAQGVHRRSQDSLEAHSKASLDWESAPIYRTVQAWAQRLHSFELRLWKTVARASGVTLPENSVSYPEDFSVRPIDLELNQAEKLTQIYGSYSTAPAFAKHAIDVKVGRALERDLSSRPEFMDIMRELDEIDYAAEPSAPSSPSGQSPVPDMGEDGGAVDSEQEEDDEARP